MAIKKSFTHVVNENDTVNFPEGKLHNVYSTYSMARDAEWVCRLFVLDMKEDDEEGIGTMIKIVHHAPAAVGSTVIFTGSFISLNKNEIICAFEAHCGQRLIAVGETGQKILKKEKLEQLFRNI